MYEELDKVVIFCVACLILVSGFLLALRYSLIIAVIISDSMSPTLEIGDRVLAFRYWPARWLHKGQIVLFWPLTNYRFHQIGSFGIIPLVKRVVGLPGNIIESTQSPSSKNEACSGKQEQIVPPWHFYVSGDLLINERDSLTWGAIPFDHLLGLVVMKLPLRKSVPLVSVQFEPNLSQFNEIVED